MANLKFLVVYILVWGANCTLALGLDSLSMETRNGSTVILHQVESKETLYSLSRRYGSPIAEIERANPGLDQGLKVGQTIRIPYQGTSQRVAPPSGNYIYHTVEPQQTLYSLARQFGVKVDQIREWNGLSGNDLAVGQQLIVGEKPASGVPGSNPQNSTDYAQIQPLPERKVPGTIIVKPNEVGNDRIVRKESGFTEIFENGLAEVIEDTGDTRKYLALHKSAPVGTILQIKNEMNNLRVFVRVIGPLPDTGNNQKILVKISKAAFDRLGAIDSKFPVVVTYFL